MHPRCGQTWLDTFGEIAKFYSSNNQLSALQIVTWNDYDEGTAMEMGIDNCIYLQPSISGSTLSWNVGGGPEATQSITTRSSPAQTGRIWRSWPTFRPARTHSTLARSI